MLTSMYQEMSITLKMPDLHIASLANINCCITMYRMADKYDYDKLRFASQRLFQQQLCWWLNGPQGGAVPAQEAATADGFSDIFSNIYQLHTLDRTNSLLESLSWATYRCQSIRVLNNGGQLSTFLLTASMKTPEFGRVVLAHTLKKARRSAVDAHGKRTITELGLLVRVGCPNCQKVWSRAMSEPLDGHCSSCAARVQDWTKCRWV
jgi:hypothetical protein